jgi:galactonate dehydratase
VRDRIALYCHPFKGVSPNNIRAAAREIVDAGFMAFKMDPMIVNLHVRNESFLDGEISPYAEEQALAILAAARDEVGPQVEILIDAHGLYNVPTAVRLANKMAEYNIHWFEEPVPPESWKALKQVKDQVKTRICTGERFHTRWDFIPIFENGLADFVMPDVTWTGGISELKKISTLAEAYYIPVSPHDASGPINVMAGAQVMMTVPNFYKVEVTRYDLSSYNVLLDHPLDIQQGFLYVPADRPGLGINLLPEALREYEVEPEQSANV